MGKRVLLIEDEPNIIEAISFILSRDGWTVHTHEDGTSAMDKVLALPPDMIILDVMLPGRSGFDILRDLRDNDPERYRQRVERMMSRLNITPQAESELRKLKQDPTVPFSFVEDAVFRMLTQE